MVGQCLDKKRPRIPGKGAIQKNDLDEFIAQFNAPDRYLFADA